jgi:hypothetical protein
MYHLFVRIHVLPPSSQMKGKFHSMPKYSHTHDRRNSATRNLTCQESRKMRRRRRRRRRRRWWWLERLRGIFVNPKP